MTANIGRLDKIFRIVIGLLLLSLVFILPDDRRWWGLLGLLPLATTVISFCPLYRLLRMNTLEKT